MPPLNAKTTGGKISDNQPEEGIDGYGRKYFEKMKVLKWKWKTPWETSTNGPGSEHDYEEELGGDDVVIMLA